MSETKSTTVIDKFIDLDELRGAASWAAAPTKEISGKAIEQVQTSLTIGDGQMEQAIRNRHHFDFGFAVRALKDGQRVARAGWNGKGMWLSLSCDGSREVQASNFWSPHNRAHAEANGGKATVLPCITQKTSDGAVQMGWTPAQADLLAEDWVIVP